MLEWNLGHRTTTWVAWLRCLREIQVPQGEKTKQKVYPLKTKEVSQVIK